MSHKCWDLLFFVCTILLIEVQRCEGTLHLYLLKIQHAVGFFFVWVESSDGKNYTWLKFGFPKTQRYILRYSVRLFMVWTSKTITIIRMASMRPCVSGMINVFIVWSRRENWNRASDKDIGLYRIIATFSYSIWPALGFSHYGNLGFSHPSILSSGL